MPTHPYQYDAFLSYAQENQETAIWLRGVLANYWVPWRRRRRIFLDQGSLAAGDLDDGLRQALANSRYLIVCCSSDAANSEWVDREVCTFAALDRTTKILVCRTGAAGDDELPSTIKAIESEFHIDLYKPDLRGSVSDWNRKAIKDRRKDALSLLAPLVGMGNKDVLLDRRHRWLHRLFIASLIGLALLTAVIVGWKWWLTTPEGRLHITVSTLKDAAADETIDDLSLIDTLASLGQLNRPSAVRNVSRLLPKGAGFRRLGLAAGLASLPQPDCSTAVSELNQVADDVLKQWPKPALLVEKHCAGDWLNRISPKPDSADAVIKWARMLANSGHLDSARQLLGDHHLTDADRFDLLTTLAPFDEHLPASREDFLAWRNRLTAQNLGRDQDYEKEFGVPGWGSHDTLHELTNTLANYYWHHRLKRPEATWLAEVGLDAADRLDPVYTNNWTLKQKLAAVLAAMGNRNASASLLDTDPDLTNQLRTDPACQPNGWAWRYLAQTTLKQHTEAARSIARAEACGLADALQSKTWSEWHTIALVYAMSERWDKAFDAARTPKNLRARSLAQGYIITLWADRHRNSQ